MFLGGSEKKAKEQVDNYLRLVPAEMDILGQDLLCSVQRLTNTDLFKLEEYIREKRLNSEIIWNSYREGSSLRVLSRGLVLLGIETREDEMIELIEQYVSSGGNVNEIDELIQEDSLLKEEVLEEKTMLAQKRYEECPEESTFVEGERRLELKAYHKKVLNDWIVLSTVRSVIHGYLYKVQAVYDMRKNTE